MGALRTTAIAVFTLFLVSLSPPATAEPAAPGDRNLFFFGGGLTRSHMGEMFNPFAVDYEGNIVVGAGYQHFLLELPHDLSFGVEAGLAARFGEADSLEVWAGGVMRYDGLRLGDVTISPALTLGVSAVTQTMGREREREIGDGRSGRLLFYLSPEINLSHKSNPDLEVFWRLHHRSSAWRTLGGGSANATTIGLRHSF